MMIFLRLVTGYRQTSIIILQLIATGLGKFGWESHNGRSYGRQELYDGPLHLTTSFVKKFRENCRGKP